MFVSSQEETIIARKTSDPDRAFEVPYRRARLKSSFDCSLRCNRSYQARSQSRAVLYKALAYGVGYLAYYFSLAIIFLVILVENTQSDICNDIRPCYLCSASRLLSGLYPFMLAAVGETTHCCVLQRKEVESQTHCIERA